MGVSSPHQIASVCERSLGQLLEVAVKVLVEVLGVVPRCALLDRHRLARLRDETTRQQGLPLRLREDRRPVLGRVARARVGGHARVVEPATEEDLVRQDSRVEPKQQRLRVAVARADRLVGGSGALAAAVADSRREHARQAAVPRLRLPESPHRDHRHLLGLRLRARVEPPQAARHGGHRVGVGLALAVEVDLARQAPLVDARLEAARLELLDERAVSNQVEVRAACRPQQRGHRTRHTARDPRAARTSCIPFGGRLLLSAGTRGSRPGDARCPAELGRVGRRQRVELRGAACVLEAGKPTVQLDARTVFEQQRLLRVADERRQPGAGRNAHDALHLGSDSFVDWRAKPAAEADRRTRRHRCHRRRLPAVGNDSVDYVERAAATAGDRVRALLGVALLFEAEAEDVAGLVVQRAGGLHSQLACGL
mmetsp:Transcript_9303/g.30812  ORF Transcript_9303/g.30812 Transcript_9303/m.30812 type:complete len:425 (-) Transcript_9303:139-1413(-)